MILNILKYPIILLLIVFISGCTSTKVFQSDEPFIYKTVVSPTTNRIWMDRNLGAKRVCLTYDDIECYGNYYKWIDANRYSTCPEGFYIPSKDELYDEVSFLDVKAHPTFTTVLKIPAAGVISAGVLFNEDTHSLLWSSSRFKNHSVYNLQIYRKQFQHNGYSRQNKYYPYISRNSRGNKLPVRCIKK